MMTPDEIAFYDALAENESAVRELGDDTLRKLAIEVTLKLRQSTTVDWQVRESVRARLRILVRQTLRKYKYPPDKTPGAVELILKQAEVEQLDSLKRSSIILTEVVQCRLL